MGEENREQAEKCKEVALNAIRAGDKEKAIKFLEKSLRMHPMPATEELLRKVKADEATEATPKPAANGSTPTPEGAAANRRRAASAAAAAAQAPPTTPGARRNAKGQEYMPEQMKDVQKILREKDYYAILGVPRDSTEAVVKKAYRKLALKMHPDKCHAPGSEEAFKKISKAFGCLSDPQKRAVFDQYGDEDRVPGGFGGRGGRPGDEMAAAQEVFEAFFGPGIFGGGGGMHQRQQRQHQQQHHHEGQQGGVPPYNFLFVIMIALMFMSNFSRDTDPGFSFSKTAKMHVPRETPTLHAKYFVGTDFEAKNAKSNFEGMVEVYYVHHLSSECDYQTTMMLKRIRKAKMSGDAARLEQAKNEKKEACDSLDKIKRKHPRVYHSALSWH